MVDRQSVDGTKHPNFIGCWMLEDLSVCDAVIHLFETSNDLQKPGVSGKGDLQESVKKSIDISVSPRDLEDDKFSDVSLFIEQLKLCYLDYLEQWAFLKTFMTRAHIGTFNIQKYEEGGHFGSLHSERTSIRHLHRTLVWMTYLNDVTEGGETEFPMFGIKVRPERGKTLIWPAEWTHAHFGGVVTKGVKYIVTGWMHHPDDS